MTRALFLAGLALALSACGQNADVNPPTQPVAPVYVDFAEAAAQGPSGMLPGRGPTSFVGSWAADVRWCAAPQGARRPIDITATRFEGYENSCEIAAVNQVADGYIATLACAAQGMTRTERVRMAVTIDTMRMTWLDRGPPVPITLHKCTKLDDTGARPVTLPTG